MKKFYLKRNFTLRFTAVIILTTLLFSSLFPLTVCAATPTVITVRGSVGPSSISGRAAMEFIADLTANGGYSVTEVGFKWGTSASNLNNTFVYGSMGAKKDRFTYYADIFYPGTTYYYKAYAINSEGTAYGETLSMKTPEKPDISSYDYSINSDLSVKIYGNLTASYGASVTANGFYYGTSSNPKTKVYTSAMESSKGVFSYDLTGLTPNTTYYFCAFAENCMGESKGIVMSFTTPKIENNTAQINLPSVTVTDNESFASDYSETLTVDRYEGYTGEQYVFTLFTNETVTKAEIIIDDRYTFPMNQTSNPNKWELVQTINSAGERKVQAKITKTVRKALILKSDTVSYLNLNSNILVLEKADAKYENYGSYLLVKDNMKNEILKGDDKSSALEKIESNVKTLYGLQYLTLRQKACLGTIHKKLESQDFEVEDLKKIIEFRFEGAGGTDSKLYQAMSVIIKNGEIVAVFFKTSTLPDNYFGNNSGCIDDGTYNLVSWNHPNYDSNGVKRSYASLQLRTVSGNSSTLPAIFDMPTYGNKKMTSSGINSHYGYVNSRGSAGCLTMPYDDYIIYMTIMGFSENQKPMNDYSTNKGLWKNTNKLIGKIIIYRCGDFSITYGNNTFVKTSTNMDYYYTE